MMTVHDFSVSEWRFSRWLQPAGASHRPTPPRSGCRLSSIIAGLVLVVLVAVLLPALQYLPLPCVAATLLHVACRMLEPDELRRILAQAPSPAHPAPPRRRARCRQRARRRRGPLTPGGG
jgi:hypothetical protein